MLGAAAKKPTAHMSAFDADDRTVKFGQVPVKSG